MSRGKCPDPLESMEDGVKIDGLLLVKAVRFADDHAMVWSSSAWLQRIHIEQNTKR